jgi:hypothetical protein
MDRGLAAVSAATGLPSSNEEKSGSIRARAAAKIQTDQ